MAMEYQNVHVRVNDSSTGKPTPVRIRFVGQDGKEYAPFGRLTQFGLAKGDDVGGYLQHEGNSFSYIDGACEISLPVGPVEISYYKGPEYFPVSERIHITKGKLALRLMISRALDLPSQNWFGSDTHAFEMGPDAALLEAGGEDLAVVNLLARPEMRRSQSADDSSKYPTITNMLSFSGQQPIRANEQHMVVVNTVNSHQRLGTLALLNCHRPVFPLTFGSPAGVDDWNLADWCEQCHRKKGLVIALDFFEREPDGQSEFIADAVLGLLDAVNFSSTTLQDPQRLKVWEDLLSLGIRLPLTAGSGKQSNADVLGSWRTYAHWQMSQDNSYQGWIEAVRSGHTFVSNGPSLLLTVNGEIPGKTVSFAANDNARVLVKTRSLHSFDTLELCTAETVLGSADSILEDNIYKADLDLEIEPTNSTYYYARCRGGSGSKFVGAMTSPVYCEVGGTIPTGRQAAKERIQTRLVTMRQWVNENCVFENDKQRQRMDQIYQTALEKLESF